MNRKIIIAAALLLLVSRADASRKNFHFLGIETDTKPPSNRIWDIVVDTVRNRIWVGTDQGLSYSTDQGATWTNFKNTEPFHNETISAFALRGDTIAVALYGSIRIGDVVHPAGAGIVVSTNYGVSWTKYDQPLDNDSSRTVRYGSNIIRAVPVTTNIENITYDIAITKGGVIWLASKAGMLRKSTDAGKTFERVVLPPDALDAIDTSGVYNFDLSPTDNSRLGLTGNQNHIVVSLTAASGGSTLWVGTAAGINRTTNGGISWKKYNHINYGIASNGVIALGEQSAGYIWAGSIPAPKDFDTRDTTEHQGISYTTNNGDDWIVVDALHDVVGTNFGFENGRRIFVATGTGAWCSPDSGKTWTRPGTIIDKKNRQRVGSNDALSIGVVPSSSSTALVFIGTGDGLVSSSFKECLYDGEWTVYRAFEKLSDKKTVYAYPTPFSPTIDIARIHYALETSDAVTVKIYDFDMKLVRTLVREAPRTGGPSVELDEIWDANDNNGRRVSNATYFFSVAAGSEEPRWGKVVVLQ